MSEPCEARVICSCCCATKASGDSIGAGSRSRFICRECVPLCERVFKEALVDPHPGPCSFCSRLPRYYSSVIASACDPEGTICEECLAVCRSMIDHRTE